MSIRQQQAALGTAYEPMDVPKILERARRLHTQRLCGHGLPAEDSYLRSSVKALFDSLYGFEEHFSTSSESQVTFSQLTNGLPELLASLEDQLELSSNDRESLYIRDIQKNLSFFTRIISILRAAVDS